MASTTALFTGLSGVLANSRLIDVVGNNIANVNTTAYKSNRLMLETAFSRTFNLGTAPSDTRGGSNPSQIGMGVKIGGTQRNFNNGGMSATGVNTDLAIEGDGFFVIDDSGNQRYTRAGAFFRDSENQLVTQQGGKVQGYGIDENYNVVAGQLTDVTIPMGILTIAEATRNVVFTGNLNASGEIGSQGTRITSEALQALSSATPPPANPPYADASTLLTDIDDGDGNPQYVSGDSIRVSGAEKGGKALPTATLEIDATTTVDDLLTFLELALGIDTSNSSDPGGVTIDDETGVITIEGNYGEANELAVDTADIVQLDSSGTSKAQPLILTLAQQANGESVRNTFIVYDSLGTPIEVDITVVLDSRDDTGTTWRYFAESGDSADGDIRLDTGTMSFDTSGQIHDPSEFTVQISRDQTGAVDPLSITLSMNSDPDTVTALTDTRSSLAAVYQDGSPIGTLTDFSIGGDGIISGTFSNGLVRTIGQVALAVFTNNEGLVDIGDNTFQTGPNSGTPVVTTPQTLGAGRIIGGTLELANVDLSQEFINLILASTGYSASGRVINTANELIQQLLLIGR